MKLLHAVKALFSRGATQPAPGDLPDARPLWDLVVGKSKLGEMTFLAYETPWVTATFSPTPEFERWVPLIRWRERLDAAPEDEGDESHLEPEVEKLLAEAQAAGGMVAVEREDPNAPRRSLFHFTDDFKRVSLR